MGRKDVDSALLLVLAYLKSNDEDARKRHVIRELKSKSDVERWQKRIHHERYDYLVPHEYHYIRTNRKNGKKYLVRSRRIHSDNVQHNLFKKKKRGYEDNPIRKGHIGDGPWI